MISLEDMKRIDFFADLTEEELENLRYLCEERSYKKGDLIFEEGSSAEYLYVLKEGKISIDIKVTGDRYLSVLTLSRFAEPFGWSALIPPYRFTASVRCVEDTRVIAINGKELKKLIEEDYRMGFLIMSRIAKLISDRARSARLQLIHTFYG